MTIDLKVLIARVLARFTAKGGVHTRAIAQPARDWKVILLCISLGIAFSASFAGFVYYRVNNTDDASENSLAAQQPKVKAAEIKTVLAIFADRATRHASYREGSGGLTDPSR